ncbi:O-antigen biosynthesis aminotransferase WlbF [Microlunatus panaciterrae]|uniref:dTDP-4-amino-4,6-dideoxygalactose transaminase n=1 Tax=Microlunatus panaciterrae TaxID=400768 RepID=A0ABS2RIY4_9ACTN|nr:DegT/DnrJ/EryC1/StrS family aminotransferase [Microlunatus panaciterrae]MBM7798537.1 dTDP-4-amino-4,6-dideoxygalactose transaminase [Microlunatus panaciterrae]
MSAEDFLPFALPDIGKEEIEAAADAMRSGWLTTGPRAAAFEREFAEFLGEGVHAVALNSATAGLHLALEAVGIGPGDEVLVPTWTFTSTAEVVRYLGADPVMVDVDPVTLNLDLEAAAAAVTPRTRAVMPVHFAGLAVDRSGLEKLARNCGLIVVEDAAHSFPTVSAGSLVGAGASEAVVFSFYATKTMTTGEGGMVVTSDPDVAKRIRTMRLHGISRDVFDRYRSTVPSWQYEVVAPGFKYNLTDPAAAMGRVQLGRAHEMRDRRGAIAAVYDEAFADLPLELPAHADPGDVHAWHLYVTRLTADAAVGRDAFIEEMARAGVGCSVHFIPLHKHPYWRDRYALTDEQFPVASAQFERVASLPIFSSMSDAQVDRVVRAVRRVLG